MQYKYIPIIINSFIIVLLTSCSNPNNELQLEGTKIEIINNNHPLEMELDSMVDSITYVSLSSEKCLLGYIENIKFDNGYYFVKDNKGLFVFDSKGDFLHEISSKGVGPDEYLYMDCFFLDRNKKHVYVISNVQNKAMCFTYEGEYVSYLSFKNEQAQISGMTMLENGSIVAYHPFSNVSFTRPYEYGVYVPKKDILEDKELLMGTEISSGDIYYPFFRHSMALKNDSLFLLSAFSSNIYVYKGTESACVYRVEMPDIAPPYSFLKKHSSMDYFDLLEAIKKEGFGRGLTGILATEEYLLLSINDSYTLLWDGNNAILLSRIFDRDLNRYFDLTMSGGISDEKLGFLEADFLIEEKERILGENNSDLSAIVKKLREDDNPVLYKYHLKKNLVNFITKNN